jgi:hypothetical protein
MVLFGPSILGNVASITGELAHIPFICPLLLLQILNDRVQIGEDLVVVVTVLLDLVLYVFEIVKMYSLNRCRALLNILFLDVGLLVFGFEESLLRLKLIGALHSLVDGASGCLDESRQVFKLPLLC